MSKSKNTATADLLGTVALVLVLLALAVGLFWWLAGKFEPVTLRWLAALSPFALVGAFSAGLAAGRLEVHGFLGGFDRALDGLSRAVDLRDHSKARSVAARPQPQTLSKIELLEAFLPARGH